MVPSYNVDGTCARLIERGEMIILAGGLKVCDKSQFSSWLKMLNKLEMEESHLNVASAIYEKQAKHCMRWRKSESSPLTAGTRPAHLLVQLLLGHYWKSQLGQWEQKRNILSVYRCYRPIHKKLNFTQHTPHPPKKSSIKTNNKFGQITEFKVHS